MENFVDAIGLLKILLTTLQRSYMFEGKKKKKARYLLKMQ